MEKKKRIYEPPLMKVVEFKVEGGFAASFTATHNAPTSNVGECYRNGGDIWEIGHSLSTGLGSNEPYNDGGSLL